MFVALNIDNAFAEEVEVLMNYSIWGTPTFLYWDAGAKDQDTTYGHYSGMDSQSARSQKEREWLA